MATRKIISPSTPPTGSVSRRPTIRSPTSENPIISGYSEQGRPSATRSTVRLYNLGSTLPATIARTRSTDRVGAVTTDGNGHFSIGTAAAHVFASSGYYYHRRASNRPVGGRRQRGVLKILVELPRVPTPTKIVLDPGSDTGTYNNDDYTQDNNSGRYPAPVFDVSRHLAQRDGRARS